MECKICKSEHRKEIEGLRLKLGWSFNKIAAHCKDVLDFDVSHTSVQRHVKTCLGLEGQQQGLTAQELEQIAQDSIIEAENVESIQELREVLPSQLARIVMNQAAIAEKMQRDYMSGNGTAPNSAVSALIPLLKTLDGLADNKVQGD